MTGGADGRRSNESLRASSSCAAFSFRIRAVGPESDKLVWSLGIGGFEGRRAPAVAGSGDACRRASAGRRLTLRSRTRSPTFDLLTVDSVGDIGLGEGGDRGEPSRRTALLPRPSRSVSTGASGLVDGARLRERVRRPSRDYALEAALPAPLLLSRGPLLLSRGPLLMSLSRGRTGSFGSVNL